MPFIQMAKVFPCPVAENYGDETQVQKLHNSSYNGQLGRDAPDGGVPGLEASVPVTLAFVKFLGNIRSYPQRGRQRTLQNHTVMNDLGQLLQHWRIDKSPLQVFDRIF